MNLVGMSSLNSQLQDFAGHISAQTLALFPGSIAAGSSNAAIRLGRSWVSTIATLRGRSQLKCTYTHQDASQQR